MFISSERVKEFSMKFPGDMGLNDSIKSKIKTTKIQRFPEKHIFKLSTELF